MAINFLNNVDYNQNQLLHPTIENQPSDAAAGTPKQGQLYYNTADDVLKVGKEVAPATTPPTFEWVEVSSFNGFSLSDNANPAVIEAIASGNTVKIAATNDLTSNLTTPTSTSKQLEIGLKVDGGISKSDNYIVNQAGAVATSDDTIPFNDYTPGSTPPSTQTNIVKKTTLGAIPVEALTLVKTYIDDSVAGGLIYQGGYNAATNTPNLENPSPNTIKKGWTYTVTADGLFFDAPGAPGEQLRVGDVLIAESDGPTTLADWTTVQNNVDLASSTQVGIGNVKASTNNQLKGLSVTYANGTATAGLDMATLTTQSPSNNSLAFIPFYDQTANLNLKVGLNFLAGDLNEFTSKAYTITDTATITYPSAFALNAATKNDTIIQLVDTVTNETVYADVDRLSTTQAKITFASTPVNSVRVLVQKIG